MSLRRREQTAAETVSGFSFGGNAATTLDKETL
jgi:alpha/beta superfamily hydrolase